MQEGANALKGSHKGSNMQKSANATNAGACAVKCDSEHAGMRLQIRWRHMDKKGADVKYAFCDKRKI